MIFLSSLVVALAAYANAAAIPQAAFGKKSGISLTCSNTILSLVSSPLSTCLNMKGLLPIFMAPASTPLIPAVNEFNTGLCAAPECAEADIESAITSVAQACATELEAFNLDETQAVALAQKLIPALKKVLCLQDATATPPTQTCLTTGLKAIEALLAPEELTRLNIKQALDLIKTGDPATTPGLQQLRDLKCSECAKQAQAILQEAFTGVPGTAGVKKLESKIKTLGSSSCDGSGTPTPPTPPADGPPTPPSADAPAAPSGSDAPTPPGGRPGGDGGDGWPEAPDEDVPEPGGGPTPPSGPSPPSAPTTPSPGGPAEPPADNPPPEAPPAEEPPAEEPPAEEPPAEEPPADAPPADGPPADGLSRRSAGTAQYIFKRLLGLLW